MPSWGEIAQIITAIAAVGAFLNSWRNSRKIEIVHKATNSMKDELVAAVGTAEHARGMLDERTKVAGAVTDAERVDGNRGS